MRHRAAQQRQRSERQGLGRGVQDAARLGLLAGLTLGIVLGLGACSLFGGSGSTELANSSGTVIDAPQGSASAELVAGPEQNGVATLVPVISEGGAEVYHDPSAYSTRHGVAITWQSDGEALWVVSSDVGTFKVARTGAGWEKSASTDLPSDVRDRLGR